MSEEALRAAVYADPLSDEPRLVYADWLSSKGKLLGEFISLQIPRARKGKRTQSRERALLAAEGKGWWADHPCSVLGEVDWENTERGFPSRYHPGWPVSKGDRIKQERALAATSDRPGWATVEAVHLTSECDTPQLAAFLKNAPWRSLTRVAGLGDQLLGRLADVDLGWTELELWLGDDRPVPAARGLGSLVRLTVFASRPVASLVDALRVLGPLERLTDLKLYGVAAADDPFGEAREAFASAGAKHLLIHRYDGQILELSGDPAKPALTVRLFYAECVEDTAAMLERLDPHAFATVEIAFDKDGSFTKKNRARFRARFEAATTALGSRVTLPKA